MLKTLQTARELKATVIRLVKFAIKTHDNQLLNEKREEIDQKLNMFGYFISCIIICTSIIYQLSSIGQYVEDGAYYVIAYQWAIMLLMVMLAKIPKRSNCTVFTLLTLITIYSMIPLMDPYILKRMDSSHSKTRFFFHQCSRILIVCFFMTMLGSPEKVKFLYFTLIAFGFPAILIVFPSTYNETQ